MFGLGPMYPRQKIIMTFGTSILAAGAAIQLVSRIVQNGNDWLYYLLGLGVTVTMLVIVRRTPTKGEKR